MHFFWLKSLWINYEKIDKHTSPLLVWFSSTMVERLLKISGEVRDLDCILVDDMIDTGTTIRLALEVLNSHQARYFQSKSQFHIEPTNFFHVNNPERKWFGDWYHSQLKP